MQANSKRFLMRASVLECRGPPPLFDDVTSLVTSMQEARKSHIVNLQSASLTSLMTE